MWRITYGVLRRGMWLRILWSFGDPPYFRSLLISHLVVVVVVWAGGTEAEPSAVEPTEAKTQLQPPSADRRVR